MIYGDKMFLMLLRKSIEATVSFVLINLLVDLSASYFYWYLVIGMFMERKYWLVENNSDKGDN